MPARKSKSPAARSAMNAAAKKPAAKASAPAAAPSALQAYPSPAAVLTQVSAPGIAIEGELTIYRASELRASWLAALADPANAGDTTIDLSRVTEIDSAGFQLLVSLVRSLRAQGRQVSYAHASAPVRDLASVYGCRAETL